MMPVSSRDSGSPVAVALVALRVKNLIGVPYAAYTSLSRAPGQQGFDTPLDALIGGATEVKPVFVKDSLRDYVILQQLGTIPSSYRSSLLEMIHHILPSK